MKNITVLGMGHMGTAIAGRLVSCGWDVTGWTRSSRTVEGIVTVADPVDAVTGSDLVLLALFDDAACAEVIDQITQGLAPDTVIVNTSTTSPDRAIDLAQVLGYRYLHAPVIGSVAAVESGALTVLAAGTPRTHDRAHEALRDLGEVHTVHSPARAAALKLVVNATLAGSIVTLRQALHHADALGLSRTSALDFLQHGPLGGLIASKRTALLDPDADPQFSARALAKDVRLLAAASPHPVGVAAQFDHDIATKRDADIARAAVTDPIDQAVLAPLWAYIRGHATGNPNHFRAAFLPTARIEGIRAGTFGSWTLDEYCGNFTGRPAPDEATRTRHIDAVTVHETVATATMALYHGPDTFTDVFLLVKSNVSWYIANKAYHREQTQPNDL